MCCGFVVWGVASVSFYVNDFSPYCDKVSDRSNLRQGRVSLDLQFQREHSPSWQGTHGSRSVRQLVTLYQEAEREAEIDLRLETKILNQQIAAILHLNNVMGQKDY